MINLIAAVDLNNALGFKNQLLCHLPNDLKRFKQLTQGNIVCMGRKTFQSIGKPLPNRQNIVLSHTKVNSPGVYVYHSVNDILKQYNNYANKQVELWVVGGGSVYKQFLPHADKIYLTIIKNEFKSVDCYFPKFDLSDWRVTDHIENKFDDKHEFDYHYVTYERKTK